jgi:hypothetical protein
MNEWIDKYRNSHDHELKRKSQSHNHKYKLDKKS